MSADWLSSGMCMRTKNLRKTEKGVPVNTPSKTTAIILRLYEEVETSAILWVDYLSSPANELAKHFTHFAFVQFSIHTAIPPFSAVAVNA